jgi:nucleoside-diphosphate-sugar epimerase
MRTPVAYLTHAPGAAGARLAAALEGAGAEVYAFTSVSDLALAASAAPPDVVVGDDVRLESIGAPHVVVPHDLSVVDAIEEVRKILLRTLAGPAARRPVL